MQTLYYLAGKLGQMLLLEQVQRWVGKELVMVPTLLLRMSLVLEQ